MKIISAVALAMVLGACATAIDSNSTLAQALPTQSAEKYLQSVLSDYPIENSIWTEISKCSFQDGHVIVLQPRLVGSRFKEVKRFPYSESNYEYQTSVPKLKESFLISKKDRVFSGAYSNKWCYVLNASLAPQDERTDIAKRTATALEAIGIKPKK